jgi:tetratricopeptide (TPR) repeat protein
MRRKHGLFTPKLLLVFVLFYTSIVSEAQLVKNLDSIKEIYNNNPQDCETLSLIAQSYLQASSDSSEYYARKLLSDCPDLDEDLMARGYNTMGLRKLLTNQMDSAVYYFNKSIEITKKENLKFVEGVYTSNLAQAFLYKGNSTDAIAYYNSAEKLIKTYDYEDKAPTFLSPLYSGLGEAYTKLGIYDKALNYLFKSYEISNELNKASEMGLATATIADVYYNLQDYHMSNTYNRKALEHFKNVNYPLAKAMLHYNLANNAFMMEQIEIAKKHLDTSMIISERNNLSYNLGNVYVLYGKVQLQHNQWEAAKKSLEKGLEINQNSGSVNNIGSSYESLGDLYFAKKNMNLSHKYYYESIHLFDNEGFIKEKKDVLEKMLSLSTIYSNKDSLNKYLTQYKTIAKEYLNVEKQKSVTAQEILHEIHLKEDTIQKQTIELEKEQNKRIKLTYGAGFLIFATIIGVWFNITRQRRKKLQTDNQLLDMQMSLTKTELNRLNQQLNPHEFKNLLQGIAPEIQEKAPQAYRHIIQLLNLIKSGLSSDKLTESIENQLVQAESYLTLQKNILPKKIVWNIENNLSEKNIQIPRLLLKNLVENSVKHGIMSKAGDGKVSIEIYNENDIINILVRDNGIGIEKQTSKKGVGIISYQKLFSILNEKNHQKASLALKNTTMGALVHVKIPVKYTY